MPRPDAWVTDAPVCAIVQAENRIYIGGEFSYVGPHTGCGAPLNLATGQLAPGSAKVNGEVYACASDGAGGWYVGGEFSRVGDLARYNLARIRADGTVDPAWNAMIDPYGEVYALALSPDKSTLYVGGWIWNVAGQDRSALVALDASTGQATDWNPNIYDDEWDEPAVLSLAISPDGSTVYAGGWFTAAGGEERHYLAALDAATALATPWNPDPVDEVLALAPAPGGGTVYVGGYFSDIGVEMRSHIAALDAVTGEVTGWNPGADSAVCALAVSADGSTVYAGGLFWSVGGVERIGIAAIDAATGEATEWNPEPYGFDREAYCLAFSGSALYVGGWFEGIGGEGRLHVAALDAETGSALDWNPAGANGWVNCLALSDSMLYAGGRFSSIGGVRRHYIAALDASTGAATDWDPNADNSVNAIAVSEDGATVYAGGPFTSIGGQNRDYIAALEAATGLASDWNPSANSGVKTLRLSRAMLAGSAHSAEALAPEILYVGGEFTHIGQENRNRLAAFDHATGALTPWDPNSDGDVWDLEIGEPTILGGPSARGFGDAVIYVAGGFSNIGGKERSGLAALDGEGSATDWNPNPNDTVRDVAVSPDGWTVYAGGHFSHIGGSDQRFFAVLDTLAGANMGWDPDASDAVRVLAVTNELVYAGGDFSSIGGAERDGLAALDRQSGLAADWRPVLDANFGICGVSCLVVRGSNLYVGGNFDTVGYGSNCLGDSALAEAFGCEMRHCFAEFGSAHAVSFRTDGTPGAVIAGDTRQIVAQGEDCSPVTAIAPTGRRFGGWETGVIQGAKADALAPTTNPLTVTNVTEDMEFTAYFFPSENGFLPDAPREETWLTDGEVYAIARTADRVYLGGRFDYVGPRTGSFVALDPATAESAPEGDLLEGTPDLSATVLSSPTLAKIDGTVYACAPDGAGGWFVGGWFDKAGEEDRQNFAHILADGSVDPAWDAAASTWGRISALALSPDGSTLYVGGSFSTIGGQERAGLAALDAETGAVADWNPGPSDIEWSSPWVSCMEVSEDGSTVYVGGWFSHIGQDGRSCLASIDADTGAANEWEAGADEWVSGMDLHGTTLYVGGCFSEIGEASRSRLAAVNAETGAVTEWNPVVSEDYSIVNDLIVSPDGSTVYVGGAFWSIGQQSRANIAAIDAETGAATDWNPGADEEVLALALSPDGSILYVGGYFHSIADEERMHLAALDARTPEVSAAAAPGGVLAWNPKSDSGIACLSVSEANVYAGGRFSSVGGVSRRNIAALDASTGAATAWDPEASDEVLAVAASPDGSTVYVGGRFDSVGGVPRERLAALHASSGQATPWDPAPQSWEWHEPEVEALAVSPDGLTVYAGGHFTFIGGTVRSAIAALDASSGRATDWNPDPEGEWDTEVWALGLSPDGSTLYVAGVFDEIGGTGRWNLAALDAVTAEATRFNPEPEGAVRTLAVATGPLSFPEPTTAPSAIWDPVVYVGGEFEYIGGESRDNIAALDPETGDATDWDPGANGQVMALAPSGPVVFAGGEFRGEEEFSIDSIGGEPRDCLAQLDAGTGEATSWNPGADEEVYCLAAYGPTLYVGGSFGRIGGQKRRHFAEFRAQFSVRFETDGTPGATIEGETEQTVQAFGDCSPVAAVAPAGYRFVNWTRGIVAPDAAEEAVYSTANPLTLTNVVEDLILKANFDCDHAVPSYFEWDAVASPQLRAWPFSVGITAQCVHGHPSVDYVGPATLEARTPDFATTVGLGTDAWNNPLRTQCYVVRDQVLYLQSEMGAARTITGLALDVVQAPGHPIADFTIRMKHTTATNGIANGWIGPDDGWTTVYSQTTTVASTGWVWFDFAAPFAYNGTDNVYIDFCFNQNPHTDPDGLIRTTRLEQRVTWFNGGWDWGDPLLWSGWGPVVWGGNDVPNILLRGYETFPVEPTESGVFEGGVWTGNVAVRQAGGPMFLKVQDGAASGSSDLFEVLEAYALDVGAENCVVGRSPDQPSYLPGTSVTLTVTPDAHYHWDSWTGDVPDGDETRNPLVVTMDSDKDVTAICAIDRYALTFETDGTQGAWIDGATLQTVDHGSDCSQVTAMAPTGWHFRNWRVSVPATTAAGKNAPLGEERIDAAGPTTNPLRVTNVTQDAVWTAVFERDRYWVVFQTDDSPGATLTGETAQRVEYGGNCTPVTANPPEGWRLRSWKQGTTVVSTDTILAVHNVAQSMTFIAHFGPSRYRLWFYTDGTEGASLLGPSPQLVEYNANSEPVLAIAPRGFRFDKWTVDGADFSSANPVVVHGVTAKMTLVAEFRAIVSDVSRPGYSTDTLRVDRRLYNDRYSRFVSPIPANLEGMVYIKTLNDDGDVAGPAPGSNGPSNGLSSAEEAFFTFQLSEPATVYVAVAETQPLPAWLGSWTRTGERLHTSNVPRRLVRKGFPAGTVSLGYNRDAGMPTGLSMYNVIVVPTQTAVGNWSLYE